MTPAELDEFAADTRRRLSALEERFPVLEEHDDRLDDHDDEFARLKSAVDILRTDVKATLDAISDSITKRDISLRAIITEMARLSRFLGMPADPEATP